MDRCSSTAEGHAEGTITDPFRANTGTFQHKFVNIWPENEKKGVCGSAQRFRKHQGNFFWSGSKDNKLMKKITKIFLRLWIGLTSVLGLIFGWAALAHSQKPVSLTAQTAAVTTSQNVQVTQLAPIPSLDQLASNTNVNTQSSFTVNSAPVTNSFTPRIRTRGS